MKIKRLELTSFRIFEQVTFEFQSGMNLLVGINGVGKSSVLDALRMLLSRSLPEFTASRERSIRFTAADFTVGHYGLTGDLHFTNGSSYSVRVRQDDASRAVPQLPPAIEIEGTFRGLTNLEMQRAPEQPIAVYFSPRRSLATYRAPSKQTSAGGQGAAYARALSHRELWVREFAEWMLTQTMLSREDDDSIATRRLQVLQSAATRFLEGYINLRVVSDPAPIFIVGSSELDSDARIGGGRAPTLLLDKNGMTLDVRQLSDGERGLLALVFDLARRLSQANPKLDDPLREGQGIVLIDELDLHLHPGWQRTVMAKLTKTFPNCQFIATTHSPQIIGECDPAGLILLTKEDENLVVAQDGHQGFGLDSSWILEHLMGTAPRNVSVQMQINRIEDAIEEGNLQLARESLADLRQTLHGDDGEVVRLEASINNLEALADEVDSETTS